MDWALALISGLGIGSALTRAIDYFLSKKLKLSDRMYSEKRESYIGLLQALRDAAITPSVNSAKTYALWQAHCELFGSKKVAIAAQKLVDTNEDRGKKGGARDIAYLDLIQAMQDDLKK